MRVFVIGAAGFVGRHFLASTPWDWEIGALVERDGADAIVGSLGAQPLDGRTDDQRSLVTALQKWSPDVTICLRPLDSDHTSVVVKSLISVGIQRAVFTSAASVATSLTLASTAELRSAEDAITSSELEYIILRPTMIYGAPGDRNMEYLLSKLITVPLIPAPHHGRSLRQPVNVYDFTEAVMAAAAEPSATSRAIAVAGPAPISLAEIVVEAGNALNRPSRVLPVPAGFLRVILATYGKLVPNPKLNGGHVDRLTEDEVVDIGMARELLDFAPRSFAEGIAAEAEAVLAGGR